VAGVWRLERDRGCLERPAPPRAQSERRSACLEAGDEARQAEQAETARPTNTTPSGKEVPSATTLSAGAPSTADPATVPDQRPALPSATPETVAPSSSAPGPGPGLESLTHQTDTHARGTSGGASDLMTAPSRAQSASGAASARPASAGAKLSDAVLTEATTAGGVAVGLQAAERKPTASSADVSKHASVQVEAAPVVDSSESGARTEPEDTSEHPSGGGEQEPVADPSPKWRANGNADGASKGTPNAKATQGDRASADEASPPANGGATKGGPAHSESDPKANSAAAPHGPSASNGNDNSNGNGNGAAHSAPDDKGKTPAPTQGPRVSDGNGSGPVHAGSDAKGAAAASPQPTVGTKGIGVAQSTPSGNSASQGATAPNGASNASTLTTQADHDGEHTSSPPPSQAPVKPHGPTGPSPSPSPSITSTPSHPATPTAPPATGQQSAGNRG
jgi:hypothetical protein